MSEARRAAGDRAGLPHKEPNVQATAQQPHRAPDGTPLHYDERHRPEQSTLYRLVRQHAAVA